MAERVHDVAKPAFGFWLATQAMIVGLAVKAALVQLHANVAPSPGAALPFSLERTLVYAAFTILIIRFYGGALRFSEVGRTVKSVYTTIKNLAGASSLFSLFYLMGESANDTALFLRFVLILHLVDTGWFLLTYAHSRAHGLTEKATISRFFLLLTLATLLVLWLVPSPVAVLAFLIGISLFDFTIFWRFYFAAEARFAWSAEREKDPAPG